MKTSKSPSQLYTTSLGFSYNGPPRHMHHLLHIMMQCYEALWYANQQSPLLTLVLALMVRCLSHFACHHMICLRTSQCCWNLHGYTMLWIILRPKFPRRLFPTWYVDQFRKVSVVIWLREMSFLEFIGPLPFGVDLVIIRSLLLPWNSRGERSSGRQLHCIHTCTSHQITLHCRLRCLIKGGDRGLYSAPLFSLPE